MAKKKRKPTNKKKNSFFAKAIFSCFMILAGVILASSVEVSLADVIPNVNYQVKSNDTKSVSGLASFYADKYNGRRTSSGEVFDQRKLTAAHKSLPFGTKLKVTNPDNGRSVIVTVNDRGPFVRGRVLDLSKAAASKIGLIGKGVGVVKMEQV
jgi:peptidoglycan lytic transglycosylase